MLLKKYPLVQLVKMRSKSFRKNRKGGQTVKDYTIAYKGLESKQEGKKSQLLQFGGSGRILGMNVLT